MNMEEWNWLHKTFERYLKCEIANPSKKPGAQQKKSHKKLRGTFPQAISRRSVVPGDDWWSKVFELGKTAGEVKEMPAWNSKANHL